MLECLCKVCVVEAIVSIRYLFTVWLRLKADVRNLTHYMTTNCHRSKPTKNGIELSQLSCAPAQQWRSYEHSQTVFEILSIKTYPRLLLLQ